MFHLSRLCFEGTRKLKVYILKFNFPWGEFCHVVERKLVSYRTKLDIGSIFHVTWERFASLGLSFFIYKMGSSHIATQGNVLIFSLVCSSLKVDSGIQV